MPTSSYSEDLRSKVIKFLEEGNTQVSAAKVFFLNASTINRWYLRYRREGSFAARKRVGAKSTLDQAALINYFTLNPDKKLSDLSKKFGMSIWGILYWLKKFGFSYKKNLHLYGSRWAAKRRIFKANK